MIYAKKVNDFEIKYVEECATEKLVALEEIEEYLCLYGDIPGGEFIEVKEGYIVSDNDYGISFFERDSVCPAMFKGILETYV